MRKIFIIGLILVFFSGATAQAISIPDENKLGQEFMKMIQDQGLILYDPVATHLINTVGEQIVKTLPSQPFHYDFYLIDDDSFNAFATPAANIFVHRGLFASLDTIDEFAGIMAHEVAHAASRHVSQSIDRSKIVAVGSIAGMLAGVLLGSVGGGDAGSAITVGSMAAGQSSMLSFTRENETEADQKAVLFLDRTGYDPQGMLSGLTKMRDTDYFGMDVIPDYFKTHPGTANRIAHIAGILADHQNPPEKPKPVPTFDFQMVKYRIMGLYGDPDQYMTTLKGKLEREPDNPAVNYGMGLMLARQRQIDQGMSLLQKALAVKVFDPMILLDIGRINLEKGAFDKALSVLEGVRQDPVLGVSATYYMAEAQLETGDITSAQTGLAQVLDKDPDSFVRAYFLMANIMSQKDDAPMSHYYLGIYHARTQDVQNALRHLTRAMETLNDPAYKEKAQKELDQVNETLKTMRQSR